MLTALLIILEEALTRFYSIDATGDRGIRASLQGEAGPATASIEARRRSILSDRDTYVYLILGSQNAGIVADKTVIVVTRFAAAFVYTPAIISSENLESNPAYM